MQVADNALFQPFPMLAGRRAQAWQHQPSFRRPRHFHEEPELNLVLQGSAVLGVGDQQVPVQRGEVLLFQPGQDHELLQASPDLELYVVALRPDLAEHSRGLPACPASAKAKLVQVELDALRCKLQALAELAEAHAVESTLVSVFAAIAPRLTSVHVLSRRALELLRLERASSAEQIAGCLRANPSHLSRHFHRDLGVGLAEFRARLRLMEFVRLVDSGQSMSHAALNADFGSYAQCHRVFRRWLSCTPKDYFAGARSEVDAAICV